MQSQSETRKPPPTLRVESPAFGMNAAIPQQFTSDGDDIAPPLAWSNPPAGTKGIAIIVEDPDAPNPAAPTTTFTHWIVTGIRPTTTSLPGGRLPEGAVLGTNDWGNRAWQGPKPPIGRHRYFFKVFALDVALDAPGITREELLGTMKGHILAQGELIGTYEKPHERRSAAKGGERRPPGHR
jgi:Raf kinase inhibitor-like YbhB/YbcL family protein